MLPRAGPALTGALVGKRSRKRGPRGPVSRSGRAPAPAPPARLAPLSDPRARRPQAPKAPWAPVPLGELATFAGIVLILTALLAGGDRAGRLLIAGFGLVSLAGLELTAREHRSGYRSHSTLLAGAAAIVLVIPLFYLTSAPSEVLLILGFVFFAAFFEGLRTLFARRTNHLGSGA